MVVVMSRVLCIIVGYFILSILNSPVGSTPAKLLTTYKNEESTAVRSTDSTRTGSGLQKSTTVISHVDKESGGSAYEDRPDPLSALMSLLRQKRKSEGAGTPLEPAKSSTGERKLQEEGNARASIQYLPKAESTTDASSGLPSVPGMPQIPGMSGIADKIPGGGGSPEATMVIGGFTLFITPVSAKNIASMAQTGQQFMPGMSSLPSLPTG